jgi:hypothetical protein
LLGKIQQENGMCNPSTKVQHRIRIVMAEIELVQVKSKVQCRFCDAPVIILLTSYDNHLRRKHPNRRRLTPQEKRDDIIFNQQQRLRRSKRIAGQEEAKAAHEFEENNAESEENSSADEDKKESDPETPAPILKPALTRRTNSRFTKLLVMKIFVACDTT